MIAHADLSPIAASGSPSGMAAIEHSMNYFAACLLMPRVWLANEVREGVGFAQLVKLFDVSESRRWPRGSASSGSTWFCRREGEGVLKKLGIGCGGLVLLVAAIGIISGSQTSRVSPGASPSPGTATAAAAAAVTTAPVSPATAAPATPKPAPTPFHFGSGQKNIGTDLAPATYRTRQASAGCYWARLSGFGGTFGEILANENSDGPTIVTILASDKGFNSTRCGEWSADLTAITKAPADPFPDGTYLVGVDIAPGTWHNSGGSNCYWQRMGGFTGSLGEIVANENASSAVNVTIAVSDKGFKSERCGTWTKVG